MTHHTKDKGDIAVGMVIANLLINGYTYAPLISEHLPFDLIAIELGGTYRTKKLQVKYSSLKNGVVYVNFRSSYSDSNGLHINTVDRSSIDAYAIYCPDTSETYYINCSEIPETMTSTLTLRIVPPKNNQKKGVWMAKDFIGVNRIF